MDQEYMTKMATSFLEELSEIEKEAGIGGTLLGGLKKGLSSLSGMAGRVGTSQAGATTMGRLRHVVGGPEVVGAGGFRKFLGAAGKKGQEAALAQGRSGTLGYLKGLAGTAPVQGALTVAAPLAAGYGLARAVD